MERRFEQIFLRNKRAHLATWMVLCVALFELLAYNGLKASMAAFSHLYAIPILIGTAAIFANILFLLRTSELAREHLPRVMILLPDKSGQEASADILKEKMYSGRRLLKTMALSIPAGCATFFILGINWKTLSGKLFIWLAICTIFALMGCTLAVACGFWAWILDFGERNPRVDVFHPDRMGGLGPVADVSDWVISMGAVLAALYSLGAIFAPFVRVNLRPFSYVWIAFAIVMLGLGFLLPARSIHSCLSKAKRMASGKISAKNHAVFERCMDGHLTDPAEVLALAWFSETLGKLNLWPYRQLVVRFGAAAALQFAPPLLKDVYTHFTG